MQKIKQIFLILFMTSTINVSGQESYNNCANAFELCPNKTFTLNNIGANATVCNNCEDDFTFCFTGENTVWLEFTTNDIGGIVTVDFSNLAFENLPGQGNGIQAAIIQATVPCVSSSYSLISNCEANGTANFSLNAAGLSPSTRYYIIVNGTMGTTDNAEATFDVSINGGSVDRNPLFTIGTNTTTICTGNTVTFNAFTQFCDDQSVVNWFLNGNLIGSTLEPSFIYSDLSNNDVVTAEVSCFNQCRDTLTSNGVTFTVHDFLVDAGPDLTIKKGQSIQLQGQTSETLISWSPSYNMSDPSVINPVVNPSGTTNYFLTVDNGSCTITDEMTVYVEESLEIPNTFSPNGDEINDTWEILGIENFPDCSIQIFSRWGQLVYQTTGYPKDKRWDGTSKSGAELASGAYYYVIDLRDDAYDKPIKGTVSLIR
ncbi:MAG TPA: gliding motility-associated C-terminal domain-containing protein [Brumimicrobium sp.]|nr:gliding motility-associated C-terminal domain-containing protein [Brumimicrobium sp.]